MTVQNDFSKNVNLNNGKKVIIGLSGGVDSATAVHFLNNARYEVIGLTFKMLPDIVEKKCMAGDGFRVCCSREAVMEARICAMRLGIRHYVANCSEEFYNGIISYFMDDYLKGKTPNPCVFCNRLIKFKFLIKYAEMLGAEYVATGHYAKIEFIEKYGKKLIVKPADKHKDQSYMLCMLPPEYVEKIVLPLGDYTKDQTRASADKLGLIVANKPDSQEICFIPDGDYQGFIRENSHGATTALKPGRIIDNTGKILGEHSGIINYTVGQRKGLGITTKVPMFVTKIDSQKNIIVVADAENASASEFYASNVNWFTGNLPVEDYEYTVKIRYQHKGSQALIKRAGDDRLLVKLITPERGVTPGQILAIYDNDCLIGGAVIS